MRCELVREYRFESAHHLPHVPEGHKCRRLHGHSFRVEIAIAGPLDPVKGWVCDFGDVDQVVAPVIDELDHRYLNELPGLANATSEVIAVWLYDRLRPHLPQLQSVTIAETCDARCVYRGER